ncbi:MAG: tyrosine-type recombinase/integrase [Myxococcota bacterium]
MTLGTYPEMTVAQAHAALGEAMTAREAGRDPGQTAVQANLAERQAPTFAVLAKLYLELHAAPRKKDKGDRDSRALQRDVVPIIGAMKAETVTRRDVIALLDGIVARGAPIQANRTLALVRKIFNFGIGRDILQQNPCYRVAAPAQEHQRDRVLAEGELQSLLANLSTAAISTESRLALRFQLLTAQRCGEALAVRWDEIDLSTGWWTIPSSKAKNKLAHRVPLSPQALAVLADARGLNPDRQTVFPSPRGDRPMVETAVARAVFRNLEHLGAGRFSPHDLRRTAASHMTGMGLSRLVVSKILNHVERGVTAVYDRHSYDSDKRAALDAWGRRLAALEAGAERGLMVVGE